ncbi:MAG: hypothetical protein AB8B55_07935 [Mariniblastus sp.]
MTRFFLRVQVFSIVFLTLCVANFTFGDEIVIDGVTECKIGDFQCSRFNNQNAQTLALGNHGKTLTAGEVWKFFDEQGFDSLSSLRLNLDVQPISDNEDFSLNSVQLKIQDPAESGHLLTNVSLQGDSLTLHGYETFSFKPEAQLEIELGYDFMTRFSADSQEQIEFVYSTSDETDSTKAVFGLAGSNGFFSQRGHSIWLVLFVGFWIAVFFVLHRFTKPQAIEASAERQEQTLGSVPGNQRALSA